MGLGWLFGKKKVLPKVPLPEGKPFDERTFQFSKSFSGETGIEPEHLQAAAGFDQPYSLSESSPRLPQTNATVQSSVPNYTSEPLFIKVEAYQRVLGELDGLKVNLNKLQDANRHLESSEYNEESNFDKLRKR